MPSLLESGGRVINVASGLAELSLPFAAAYAMSKRGLAAYSDVLRLEYGSRIRVTTVLPGYIRTPIHDDSEAQGISLSGLVPREDVEPVAGTIARAALARRPPRDAGSSRGLDIQLRLLRHVPRRWIDRAVNRHVRRQAQKGRFAESELGRRLAERLR
jgi:NAD(P)-dependent dehydrogenase (short-subunit alcohol dehydrogenase family)